jgi:1,6-anhydro-N-acetylmuramate kinase
MAAQLSLDLPTQSASVLSIGLMSGTSQHGVDVALIDTDGDTVRR